MPRAGTRSQRQPSQSQPRLQRGGQAQSQRVANRDDEDDEEDEQEGAVDQDEDMRGTDAHSELERKAQDLVRLALFTENKRIPLKRDEISKKVLGSSTRAFNTVLARAQEILRKTFGLELVELQSRAALDQDADDKDADLLKNTGVKRKGASSGTKTYILRSVLHPAIIAQANAPDPEILALEREEPALVDGEDARENDSSSRATGSILAWHQSDELGSVGVLYTVLALILVDGRVMRENDLRAYLKRLGLPANATVPITSRVTQQSLTVDSYLTQLIRQGYLDRQRIGEIKGAGGKRGRGHAATQAAAGDDNAAYEWRWGSRAMSEVGEKAIARFMTELLVENPGQNSDDEDDGPRGSRRAETEAAKKKYNGIIKGIERAAGGAALQDVL
ncbi:uncharacterized protein FIBRA_02238 [Fibroporia radiculosa]|uniref:MAGE domain-containing protein n=1 Tax=Fibroporia radiculosa TaxID=599839 RepID=J4GMP3_9APHY|nr:uncharacterized protein FIBRA_02238 [Fibroporia radiculosa]CCM00210.1 predicted protein [Fibroporia radiculosa]